MVNEFILGVGSGVSVVRPEDKNCMHTRHQLGGWQCSCSDRDR